MRLRDYFATAVTVIAAIYIAFVPAVNAAPMTISQSVKLKDDTTVAIAADGGRATLSFDYENCGLFSCVPYVIEMTDAHGKRDTSWGKAGIFTWPKSWKSLQPAHLYPGADGSLVVSGDDDVNGLFGKIDSHGVVDTSFGYQGLVRITAPKGASSNVNEIVTCGDGSVFVSAEIYRPRARGPRFDLFVRRYLANGKLDTHFARRGDLDVANDTNELVCDSDDSIELMSGRVIFAIASDVSGTSGSSGASARLVSTRRASNLAFVRRYTSSGSLDSAFGFDGMMTFGGAHGATSISGVTRQGDGATIFAYVDSVGLHFRRLLPSGQLDPAFGVSDMDAGLYLPGIHMFQARVAQLPDGRYFVTGVRFGEFDRKHPSSDYLSVWVATLDNEGVVDRSSGTWVLPPRKYGYAFTSNVVGVSGNQPFTTTAPLSDTGAFGGQALTFFNVPASGDADVTPPGIVSTHRSARVKGSADSVRLSWSPGSDTGTGVNYYEVQARRLGTKSWSGFNASGLEKRFSSIFITPSARIGVSKTTRGICIRVRAFDRVGLRGPWSAPRCDKLAPRE